MKAIGRLDRSNIVLVQTPQLNRRGFLKVAAGAALYTILPSIPKAVAAHGGGPRDESQMAQNSSNLTVGHYAGRFYQSSVPDTLDLALRAEVALNVLTRATRADSHYDVWFYVDFSRKPPVMFRPISLAKFWEAASMVRLITGSDLNLPVDQVWARQLNQLPSDIINKNMIDFSRGLRTTAVQAVRMQDRRWRARGDLMVRQAALLFVHRKGFCYLPTPTKEMPIGPRSGDWALGQGWALDALSGYYRATGYEPARKLARGIACYFKDHARIFDNDGRFLGRSEPRRSIHFHSHGICMLGLAEYALLSGDAEFGQFAQKIYEYARSVGAPLVGYFPEYVNVWPDERARGDCEGCCVADMVSTALWLTEAGVGDYWDDVDRYVRNQLAEMQLQSVDWIYRMIERRPATPVKPYPEETADHVPERNVGAFAGWSAPNDFSTGQGWIMQCCTGNCSRTLYFVWKRMLNFSNGRLRLNLLLNRASQWADVNSYIPYQGRVELKIKQPCRLEVRLPEWVRPQETAATINHNQKLRRLEFEGRYAKIGPVKADDLVAVTFPIAERTTAETIGKDARYPGERYTLTIKGNDVVSIDPPGKFCPYYQRARYRESEPRRKDVVKRFISTQELPW